LLCEVAFESRPACRIVNHQQLEEILPFLQASKVADSGSEEAGPLQKEPELIYTPYRKQFVSDLPRIKSPTMKFEIGSLTEDSRIGVVRINSEIRHSWCGKKNKFQRCA
jgi:hypothetical protein